MTWISITLLKVTTVDLPGEENKQKNNYGFFQAKKSN